ncbi:hypothetical protein TNCV_3461051 [Trichonephila clavipes]|nr:hypothetical protein TNCV_3461051 [Trichonephila clavipes]
MATGSSLTQNYSRSQSEIQGDLHNCSMQFISINFKPHLDKSDDQNVCVYQLWMIFLPHSLYSGCNPRLVTEWARIPPAMDSRLEWKAAHPFC